MLQLTLDPETVMTTGAWIGDRYTYPVQLADENGSPVDVTSGTLSITYTDVATGSAYSFGGGSATLTKQYAAEGIADFTHSGKSFNGGEDGGDDPFVEHESRAGERRAALEPGRT